MCSSARVRTQMKLRRPRTLFDPSPPPPLLPPCAVRLRAGLMACLPAFDPTCCSVRWAGCASMDSHAREDLASQRAPPVGVCFNTWVPLAPYVLDANCANEWILPLVLVPCPCCPLQPCYGHPRQTPSRRCSGLWHCCCCPRTAITGRTSWTSSRRTWQRRHKVRGDDAADASWLHDAWQAGRGIRSS